MQTPQHSRITPTFLIETLEFLGETIAKPFYLLNKIIFIIKSKEKILFTTNLKQPHQTTKVKPLFL